MSAVGMIFELIGSICFLLFGMKLMSDGIQKSAGEGLHRVLGLMTGNRFLAVLTGLIVTMIIQSSSATTVMVVSFVNAGILTLAQSVGVIFGANIGTTITAWIVALFGFKFSITAFAVPAFGIGYILTVIKKLKKKSVGEALMGFGLLFLGLSMLTKVMPTLDASNISFLTAFTDKGILSLFVGVLAGTILTVIIHSSSAATAIIITMSFNQLIPWEFAAAMVLGSNIGTTIDSVIASIGTKVNARRAALVHVLFNVTGTILAMIFFKPLLSLVDLMIPGPVQETITIHIALLHTLFNVANTIIFLPFTNQMALLTEKLIPSKKDETPAVYKLDSNLANFQENAAGAVLRAEKEIVDMSIVVRRMVTRMREGFVNRTEDFVNEHFPFLEADEAYADQMQEGLSNYLVHCLDLPITDRQRNNISQMLHITEEFESLTDDCLSIAILLKRSIEKKMEFDTEDMARFNPYLDLVTQFVSLITDNMNHHLNEDKLIEAQILENQIDEFRKNLKKVARKRLEKGADVKSELLYIDLVRNLEKIGDRAFSISEALNQTV